MNGWLVVALILLFLFVLVAMTQLTVTVRYERMGENDKVNLNVTAWFGLIRLHFLLPFLKLRLNKKKMQPTLVTDVQEKATGGIFSEFMGELDLSFLEWLLQRYQEILERFNDLHPILRDMFRQVRCDHIQWSSSLGTGDAAATGALTGVVWGAKSMVVAMFSHYISLRATPRIHVEPVWNDMIIRTQFHCILRFRVGHAIMAGVRILMKLRKGRARKWQTTLFRA